MQRGLCDSWGLLLPAAFMRAMWGCICSLVLSSKLCVPQDERSRR